jgi:hypothetical protein
MLRWIERRLIYAPWPHHVAKASDLGRPFEEVLFPSLDATELHGWYFPAPASSRRSRWALLHLHGNAGNVSHRLFYYQAWLELGLNVLAFDFRGYGRSAGVPDEKGTCLDAQAAYQWLRGLGFEPERIVVLGKSLGGGMASELALREPVGGLVLQSTFTSIPNLGSELYPWLPVRWMNSIRYDTQSKLPWIAAPVLVMHSRRDGLIGFHHAEENFAAAREPKMFWELEGDHNHTLEADRARYLQGLERFLSRLEK